MDTLSRFRRIAGDFAKKYPYRILAAIVAVYFVMGVIYLTTTPVFEKQDEEWHFAYSVYLIDHHTPPPLDGDIEANPAEQIAGHPPLYYFLASRLLLWTKLDQERPELKRNPFWAYPAPGTVNDNKNRFTHPANELLLQENRSFYLLRLLSLLLGVGAVIGAYTIASSLAYPPWVGLTAAAGVAIMPQYLYIASSVSNDSLMASLSTLAIITLILAIRPGAKWRLWIIFGILAGLATLTKSSGLILEITGVVGAMLYAFRKRSWRSGGIAAGSILLTLIIIVGWWYARNAILFHDPLGSHIHQLKMGRKTPLSLSQIIGQWRFIERSFWAAFGRGNVLLPASLYWGGRIAEIAALIGLGVIMIVERKKSNARKLGLWLLLMLVAGFVFSLGLWTMTIRGSLGRLLFPAISVISLLMVIGLSRIRRLFVALFLLWLVTISVISPFYIAKAYRPQKAEEMGDLLADFHGAPIQFEDIARLTYYHINPDHVWPQQQTHVTLCWKALRRTKTDYAVFMQILGPNDAAFGYRASYPGRGNAPTTFWRQGERFCDDYMMNIRKNAPGPSVYPVAIWLYSPEKHYRPVATIDAAPAYPVIIGYIKVNGKNRITAPDTGPQYVFSAPVKLLAYEWSDASPGDVAPITFYWQAAGKIEYPYSVFIHLIDDEGAILAQSDAQPHNDLGDYPMNWWDKNETVADTHFLPLPKTLPAGVYTLRVGLYRLDTLARVPLVNGNDSIDLGRITIR